MPLGEIATLLLRSAGYSRENNTNRRILAEIPNPISKGTIKPITLETGDWTYIRLFGIEDLQVSASIQTHQTYSYIWKQTFPIPILKPEDVLPASPSVDQTSWPVDKDLEVRPIPDGMSPIPESFDAWVRSTSQTFTSPWSCLRMIDSWATPMLLQKPTPNDSFEASNQDHTAATLTSFRMSVSSMAQHYDCNQWLLRRSHCVLKKSGLLLEVGSLLTPKGNPLTCYSATRSLIVSLKETKKEQSDKIQPNAEN